MGISCLNTELPNKEAEGCWSESILYHNLLKTSVTTSDRWSGHEDMMLPVLTVSDEVKWDS